MQTERFTVNLPAEIIQRVRDCAYWHPALTLGTIAAIALTDFVDDMERERGRPYPPGGQLKRGRPKRGRG